MMRSNDSTVHWSVFGGYANSVRPEPYYQNVNNWTVLFDAKKSDLKKAKDATLTVSRGSKSETCKINELIVMPDSISRCKDSRW